MFNRNTLWISYSALSDFNKCKRAYYYKHIYRNPKNNNRIQIVNPYLSLGSIVHESIEGLSAFSPSKRKEISLTKRFEEIWENYRGKKGGFISEKQEKEFKERGEKMIERAKNSDLIKKNALNMNDVFPKFTLFKDVELVGSIDWIEILNSGKSHIIDFKTGKNDESGNSLQLPIYLLLAKENFDKNIDMASYFYLDRDNSPILQEIGTLKLYLEEIKEKANQILKVVKEGNFSCSSGYKSCFHCKEFDSVFSGLAEYVGYDEKMKKELYYVVKEETILERVSGGNFLSKIEKDIFNMKINGKDSEEIAKDTKKVVSFVEKTILDIKNKLKNNLSSKELKVFIKKISK